MSNEGSNDYEEFSSPLRPAASSATHDFSLQLLGGGGSQIAADPSQQQQQQLAIMQQMQHAGGIADNEEFSSSSQQQQQQQLAMMQHMHVTMMQQIHVMMQQQQQQLQQSLTNDFVAPIREELLDLRVRLDTQDSKIYSLGQGSNTQREDLNGVANAALNGSGAVDVMNVSNGSQRPDDTTVAAVAALKDVIRERTIMSLFEEETEKLRQSRERTAATLKRLQETRGRRGDAAWMSYLADLGIE